MAQLSLHREIPESGFKTERRRNITLTPSCITSFGNSRGGEEDNTTDSWLTPRDTARCFMEALCRGGGGRWIHLKPAQGEKKEKLEQQRLRWPISVLMEPLGCRVGNYDWPRECVVAGHLWPRVASNGPAPSIKQGQDVTVYKTVGGLMTPLTAVKAESS